MATNIPKEIYLSKIGQRGKITIWRVDGRKIRDELETEFTNCGHHFMLPVIPENEFWIDKEAACDETQFFIDGMLTQYKLMVLGLSRKEAAEFADFKEKSEREKQRGISKLLCAKDNVVLKKIRVSLLGKTEKGVEVYLVNGRLVRTLFYLDFTEGGHHLVYPFVPRKEVWIDNDLAAGERNFILLHELYERRLMRKGRTYDEAHYHASRLEWRVRQNPELLSEKLLTVGWKNGLRAGRN